MFQLTVATAKSSIKVLFFFFHIKIFPNLDSCEKIKNKILLLRISYFYCWFWFFVSFLFVCWVEVCTAQVGKYEIHLLDYNREVPSN